MSNAGDIQSWLAEQGLAKYAEAFTNNDIDLDVLPELTDADLKDLGITSLGDRKRLLKAIASMGAPTPPATSSGTSPSSTGAERRQITVLFCDLVGSTALANRLDAEDVRDVIHTYHKCCADIVGNYDGSIAQYLGDGVMVRFGYPKAHEDDADRAIRCGLEMIKAVGALKVPTAAKLEARVGIATGVVVVGDQSSSEVGETPNLAARLQSLAHPGSIIIADSTKMLIGGLFECRDMGTVTVKGYEHPVQAWQVLALSKIESRFEALRSHELTPLVGRDDELELLLRRWRQAKEGEGQVVLFSGEPGIGKSRLVAEFQDRIATEPYTCLQYFFSPYHATSALYPVISQLGHAAKFHRDDDAAARLDKLDALLARAGTTIEDAALIADLLALPANDRYPPLDLTPQQRKDKTFAALLRQLEALTREQPVLMVFEDAHWSDPSSRELLDLTIERIKGLPALLFVTFRPEFEPPWRGQSQVMTLTLSRLNRRNGAVLAKRMVGNKGLPDHVVDDIVERADGVPLFVEELTKSVMERGLRAEDLRNAIASAPSPALSVPATLHAPLMARLDALGPAKEVAQIGSAIGREFSFELVSAVAGQRQTELRVGLDKLVDAGLIFQRGTPPQATFLFKHALIQDAAYGTLLRRQRQSIHKRIAEWLIERTGVDGSFGPPEVIARHCQEAGDDARALTYWEKGGELAEARGASYEAAADFRQALALADKSSIASSAAARVPVLCMKLGNALMQAEGYNSAEGLRAYRRAREVAKAGGRKEAEAKASIEIGPLLFGICHYQEVLNITSEIQPDLANLRPEIQVQLMAMNAIAKFCVGDLTDAWDEN
jgi:class 3 adenylate cyclase